MSQELAPLNTVFQQLPSIVRRRDVPFSVWTQEMLLIGLHYFSANAACLSRIDNKELHNVECISEGSVPERFSGQVVPVSSTFCGITAGSEKAILAPDTQQHEKLAGHPAINLLPQGYWGVAIYFGGAVWGTLSFSRNTAEPRHNDAQDEDALVLMAGMLEMKLENEEYSAELEGARQSYSELSQRLEHLQFVDTLTELPSRRALFDYLHRELNQLIRRDGEGAVALVDIDFLRMTNEKYGHDEGDRILKGVATALRHAIRNYDYVARYSGEQFIVWLPDTLQSEVAKVCERMATHVNKCLLDGKPVTISVGYCAFRSDSEYPIPYARALDKLINMAHNALLEAKNQGRNCAVSASKKPITITSLTTQG
ncbi:sensor domain-containing diguanylate cyclase [Enterovibrio norvegicus]|uniref:diguanylate cyclase n=1 Tax=Enterovibrio norvegicus TaxID=188144 RepID=A0A2N7L558_9GAMM|nr:sensor domain-containing diguanylate cyclase [Enterovibrio norvegicus]PML81011.1 diguanylate cyclase [Enterovibrio norvegicus]PMN88764.1 diguanylate cyclase [Enterovibrio norvegicus]